MHGCMDRQPMPIAEHVTQSAILISIAECTQMLAQLSLHIQLDMAVWSLVNQQSSLDYGSQTW